MNVLFERFGFTRNLIFVRVILVHASVFRNFLSICGCFKTKRLSLSNIDFTESDKGTGKHEQVLIGYFQFFVPYQQFPKAIYPGMVNFNNLAVGIVAAVVLVFCLCLSPAFDMGNESL
jgi:hypothetical protein